MNQPEAVTCSQCGAENKPGETLCWLCSRSLLTPSATARPRPARPENNATFSLATLMLVMTLVGLCAALFRIAPGLGFYLAIFALPALIRTNFILKRRAEVGEKSSLLIRALVFAGSLATVMTVTAIAVVASVGTFCAVCISAVEWRHGGPSDSAMASAILVAGLASIFTTVAAIAGMRVFFRWRQRSWENKHAQNALASARHDSPDKGNNS